MMRPRIAIIGLGSAGSRHVDNLLSLGYDDLVGHDLAPNMQEHRLPILHSLTDIALWKPTHALVCTPPASHLEVARYLLDIGCDVFVEKPLCIYSNDAIFLCERAKTLGRVLAVGYQLRVHQAVQAMPRTWHSLTIWDRQDWASWPAATYHRDMLLEFSHELDLALYVCGGLTQILPMGMMVRQERDERWMITMGTQHTGWVTIHLDCRYTPYHRGAVMERQEGRFVWRFDKKENDEAYRHELVAFLKGEPLATGEDGAAVLKLIDRIRKAC